MLLYYYNMSLCIVRLQQHGLLQGERLLCVPVVWSSEQLGELLPYDRLLLLELCPVLQQAVWVVAGKRELLNRRHLGFLEARRAGHSSSRGLRGPLVLWPPHGALCSPPQGPPLWKVVQVGLASPVALKAVVHWGGVDLRGGGELLQVDGGGAALGFTLQGGLRWRADASGGVVGGAVRWLSAVGGEGVVHESLLQGEAVGMPLGGGVHLLPPERQAGGRGNREADA
ncbi:hypothetical protein INR49_001700 [Caranx melampygus]|nr:hypothetical protein INR49_001700 [Caranx melampygus]